MAAYPPRLAVWLQRVDRDLAVDTALLEYDLGGFFPDSRLRWDGPFNAEV